MTEISEGASGSPGAEQIPHLATLLTADDRGCASGCLRDRAIILTLTLTGRPRAEVLTMTAVTSTKPTVGSGIATATRAASKEGGNCHNPRSSPSRRRERPSGVT